MASKYVTIKIPTRTEQHKRKRAGDYLGWRFQDGVLREEGIRAPRMAEHY